MLESKFVSEILKPELEARFPGCLIIKQDPNTSFQGVLDHLVLYRGRWAALESKRNGKASKQPNQLYYRDKMNEMSYAAFVDPTNYLEVMEDLEKVFNQ